MTGQAATAAARPLSFQDMILRLHAFWSERGCLILQPYDMEVGAGTFWSETTAWVGGDTDLDTMLTNIDESWPAS